MNTSTHNRSLRHRLGRLAALLALGFIVTMPLRGDSCSSSSSTQQEGQRYDSLGNPLSEAESSRARENDAFAAQQEFQRRTDEGNAARHSDGN